MSTVIEIITAAGATSLILLQLYLQHRSSLKLQRTAAADQMRLEVYKEFSEKIAPAENALSDCHLQVGTLLFDVQQVIEGRRERLQLIYSDLAASFNKASEAFGELIRWIERYEIAFSGFTKIKDSVAVERMSLLEAQGAFTSSLMIPLVVEKQLREGKPVPGPLPLSLTPELVSAARESGRNYQSKLMDFLGYVWDIRIESQNALLGDVFDRKLGPRRPGDPSVMVLGRVDEG